ncbi:hypothetical protein TEA_008528 [Camellia sinensis var. sinensis]|uniref:cellulase n=1 Tax=Camellia sinensis var. sinensis TaxID=542762 RepID=A0A4S4D696_CAMSN|nr:hypothetical protein TEA_008528 [Camellia sinensis var. sinensis]
MLLRQTSTIPVAGVMLMSEDQMLIGSVNILSIVTYNAQRSGYLQRPEDMPTSRQVYKIYPNNPGSDLAGETTAAMTAASVVFRHHNPSYANELLHVVILLCKESVCNSTLSQPNCFKPCLGTSISSIAERQVHFSEDSRLPLLKVSVKACRIRDFQNPTTWNTSFGIKGISETMCFSWNALPDCVPLHIPSERAHVSPLFLSLTLHPRGALYLVQEVHFTELMLRDGGIYLLLGPRGDHVFAADLLGHGRSDGIRCYLGDLEKIAATSLSFFVSVRHSEEYKDLPAFLFGESMGGAATMLMYFQSEPSTKNLLVRGCASFFCFGRAAAGLESPSPFKVGPAQQQDILPAPPVTDKGKDHIHTTDLVEDDSNTGKLALKSNLKKPTNTLPVSGGVVSECEVLCENGRDIPGHMERRKVQWTAASGGEIAQIREFELSDVGGSDDEFDNGDERHCSCRIM